MDSHQDFCSYELSKALKACGFDEPCDHYWNKEFTNSDKVVLRQASADDYNNDDWDVPHCSAPHIYHAQKWLREKKGIVVVVMPFPCDYRPIYYWGLYDIRGGNVGSHIPTMRETYEQALSAGISEGLDFSRRERTIFDEYVASPKPHYLYVSEDDYRKMLQRESSELIKKGE